MALGFVIPTSPYALVALGVGIALLYKVTRIGRRGNGLPPGPPTRPLLGNLLEFPTSTIHFAFTKVRPVSSCCRGCPLLIDPLVGS